MRSGSLGWVAAVALVLPGGAARPGELPPLIQESTPPRGSPGRTIAGVVVREHGWAGTGAAVTAYRIEPPGDGPRGAPASPAAHVYIRDAWGRFELHGLADGDYRVVATERGYFDSEVRAAAGAADVRIEIHEGPFVRGRVVGAGGAPVYGFTLNGRYLGTSDGRFRTLSFGGGEVMLHIEAEGYVPLRQKVQAPDDASIDIGDVQLVRGRTVVGRVVDARTGAPVAGAGVTPREAGTPFVAQPWLDEVAKAPIHSDAEGRFEVDGVVEGLALRVAARGYGPRSIGVGAEEVSVAVRLARGGRIEVRARDAAGAALRGLELRLVRAPAGEDGPELIAVRATDAEGRFTASDLAAGAYLVNPLRSQPRVPGLSGRQVTVAAGETTVVDLRARADGARLVVTLEGPGARADGLGAALVPGDHTGLRRVSDAISACVFEAEIVGDSSEARYTYERLEPGRYTVMLLDLDQGEAMLTRLVDVVGPAQAITIEVPAKLPRPEDEREVE